MKGVRCNRDPNSSWSPGKTNMASWKITWFLNKRYNFIHGWSFPLFMLVFRFFSPKSPNLLVDFRNDQKTDERKQSLILHDFNRCFSPELRVYQDFSYLCPRIYVHIYNYIYIYIYIKQKTCIYIYTYLYISISFSNKQYHCLRILTIWLYQKNIWIFRIQIPSLFGGLELPWFSSLVDDVQQLGCSWEGSHIPQEHQKSIWTGISLYTLPPF